MRCKNNGRKAITNLDSKLKSRDITLPTKVCLVKSMAFPVVMYGPESWTINKADGGDKIPGELFQILKDDAVKVLHSICQQIWKTQQQPQNGKRSVFIPTPKEGVVFPVVMYGCESWTIKEAEC